MPRVNNQRSTLISETATLYAHVARLLDPVRLLVWEEMGITFPQLRILFRIDANPHIDLRGLADALHISASAASQQVDKLVAKGLLTRSDDPADRRRLHLELTPQAEEAVGEISRSIQEYSTNLIESFSDDDLQTLHRLLGMLVEANTPPPAIKLSTTRTTRRAAGAR
jgi:DNA-binding MarR family transcriptional regulator